MANSYPAFHQWVGAHRNNGWEVTAVDTSVQDFGAITWKTRPLEGLVSKAIVKSKSRERGEYRDDCFLFAIVFDDEFDMVRDPLEGSCSDNAEKLLEWKVGHDFRSQWLVSPQAAR
jgi:hypothetical protein|nr:hypothetical protein [Neorhizobium tomejilense]